MYKTTYRIKKMDCAAEEGLIRMKLDQISGIRALTFDIPERRLEVVHEGSADNITKAIDSLNFNSSVVETSMLTGGEAPKYESPLVQRKVLIQVLAINFFFFILEVITGLIAGSMGLVADSLDMLADAIVYGLALFVVGKAAVHKRNIAKLTGYLQLLLALAGFTEVIRRFAGHAEAPDFTLMVVISTLALGGNVLSLYLLQRSKSKEVHMKATMICTSNDVIVNFGVIVAGVLVYFTSSPLPDLVIGTIVFSLVGYGAMRILKI